MAPSDAAALVPQHAARAPRRGRQRVAALFGVSPHTSHWSLWQIKAGRVAAPDISGDNRVRWGCAWRTSSPTRWPGARVDSAAGRAPHVVAHRGLGLHARP